MNESHSAKRPLRSPPIGAVGLALLAGLLYCAQLAVLQDSGHSDAAGNGLTAAFVMLSGMALWTVLAGLMLVAFKNGKMPAWAAIGALLLLPLSGYASFSATDLSPVVPRHQCEPPESNHPQLQVAFAASDDRRSSRSHRRQHSHRAHRLCRKPIVSQSPCDATALEPKSAGERGLDSKRLTTRTASLPEGQRKYARPDAPAIGPSLSCTIA